MSATLKVYKLTEIKLKSDYTTSEAIEVDKIFKHNIKISEDYYDYIESDLKKSKINPALKKELLKLIKERSKIQTETRW